MNEPANARPAPPYLRTPYNWWNVSGWGYYKALDNILVQYYGPHGGGPPQNFRVGDWVPQARPNVPGVFPNAYMGHSLATMRNDDVFVNPVNYGKMRGASDHLGLWVDV
jgi:hypothetical protein